MKLKEIKPTEVTNFKRSQAELELFWIYCLCVAGKNADNTARVVNKLFHGKKETPFQYLRKNLVDLHNILVAHRVGQYTRLEQAITKSLDLNLRTCSVEDMMKIHGVGNKTSRFFILHSRENADHCVLDIHILKWLRDRWKLDNIPTNTPQNDQDYARLENITKNLMKADYPDLSLAEADLLIWGEQSNRL